MVTDRSSGATSVDEDEDEDEDDDDDEDDEGKAASPSSSQEPILVRLFPLSLCPAPISKEPSPPSPWTQSSRGEADAVVEDEDDPPRTKSRTWARSARRAGRSDSIPPKGLAAPDRKPVSCLEMGSAT